MAVKLIPVTKETVGAKLKEIRLKTFKTTRGLEGAIGVSYQAIDMWESGARFPRIDLLEKALSACGWKLAAFFASLEKEMQDDPVEALTSAFRSLIGRDPEALEFGRLWIQRFSGTTSQSQSPQTPKPEPGRKEKRTA